MNQLIFHPPVWALVGRVDMNTSTATKPASTSSGSETKASKGPTIFRSRCSRSKAPSNSSAKSPQTYEDRLHRLSLCSTSRGATLLAMARITVEDCVQKVSSRFELVMLASKRARQLLKGAKPLVESDNRDIVIALREIAAGKVRWA